MIIRLVRKFLIIILVLLSSSQCTIKPSHSPENSIQFLLLGDQGAEGQSQKLVAQAMAQKALVDPVQFVILLGDNFYPAGVKSIDDPQWSDKFENMYSSPSLQVPFYAVLGNHDYYGNTLAQVHYTQKSSRWNMQDEYYTFSLMIDNSTQVQFFALDTMLIAYNNPSTPQQVRWLERELRKSQAHWKIVYGHHHIYSYGDYGTNKTLRKILEPIFKKNNVDIYMSGHDHTQQLIQSDSGIFYIISGTGSSPQYFQQGENILFVSPKPGFAWLKLSRNKLIAQFITTDGEIEYEYTIKKIQW